MTKIMLVEDDKSLREIYGVRLLAEGYEIISAGDGEEALAMAVKEKPELILSDVMMPKISGFDMLDILRSTPETKDIKVIMMTALSSEDQRARGEKLGANRYLVKSQVGIEDVVRTVHEILEDIPVATISGSSKFGIPIQTAAIINQPSSTTPESTIPPSDTVVNQPLEPVGSINEAAIPTIPDTAPHTEPVASTFSKPELSESDIPPLNESKTLEPTIPQTNEMASPVKTVPIENTPIPAPAPTIAEPPLATDTSQLPQPTAPFSTSAPTSFGNQIINQSKPTSPEPDMNKILNEELHDGSETNPTTIQ